MPRKISPYEPFSSKAAAILMGWAYNGGGSKDSAAQQDLHAHDMFRFGLDTKELGNHSHARETALLDKYLEDAANPFHQTDGWRSATLYVPLPDEGHKQSEASAPKLEVPGFKYRRLFDVLKSSYQSERSKAYHFTPFEQRWIPDDENPETSEAVYSEVYSSQAMRDAHRDVNALPRDPDDSLERVVMPMMLWSDATHLASFGTASAWPIYLYFGSESKYARAKPTSQACHHVAYLPSLPADFQTQFRAHYGRLSSANVKTHCKRELMHAALDHLLDDDFLEAYHHGIVLMCTDGVARRFFPRIFTYSADYPEKVLLATIKNQGRCPCPRCFVTKDQIPEVATPADMESRKDIRVDDEVRQKTVKKARRQLFTHARSITSDPVKTLLDATSMTPTINAFSKLNTTTVPFNFHKMLVVDLLHEFELGIWKAVFTHLLRLLYALGGDRIARLNERYRQMPTFGRDTIRKFSDNVSEMKKLAARDFEDMLQCAIAAFDGLFEHEDYPGMNATILDLLFCLLTWHAYAKLRLHTDSTIDLFKTATTALGESLRIFCDEVCSKVQTKELPKEADVRRRTAARRNTESAPAAGTKIKLFNMSTVKMHFFPDYPETIQYFGTTDNYNTQTGELQHRQVKRRYAKSGKVRYIASLAKQDARERFIAEQRKRMEKELTPPSPAVGSTSRRRKRTDDDIPFTDPKAHYHIAEQSRDSVNLIDWLDDNDGDPALKNFRRSLIDHILARVHNVPENEDRTFTDTERGTIVLKDNKIFFHQVLRVNYTTYDIRREQDSMNPRTHADIMVLSGEDPSDPSFHPYWYGRILRIFHVLYQHIPSDSPPTEYRRMDVVWVHWMARDVTVPSGWAARRLPCVGPANLEDSDAVGFLNPNDILRGAHLLPAFSFGTTDEYATRSLTRPLAPGEPDVEWRRYFVNMFVDRDTFMLHRGGGIGHVITRPFNKLLRAEAHTVPERRRSRHGSSSPASNSDDSDEDAMDDDEDRGGHSDVPVSDDDAYSEGSEDGSARGEGDSEDSDGSEDEDILAAHGFAAL
ncbi:hypothetical protein FA95DRAFT_1527233 [Auriscalpium vulgare]|uniref:Uncharacterized protein n=1 Tax=Auriscalpium vulgare TaxID=40419 RepID=A0ACB8RB92_9AGAM|nr:hypothetical protein FA95DRAFT_1527233 [Auriscalpium vulgare]